MTSGSLGHGLPTAVGIAWAKRHRGEPGAVHVLIGDGECQEGTTYEALNLARHFQLINLIVHIDLNGYQGSEALLHGMSPCLPEFLGTRFHRTQKGAGIRMFESNPAKSVHLVTAEDYATICEELS